MDVVEYLLEYQVLVCKSCRYALQPKHIAAHFRSKEHRMSREESEQMAAMCLRHVLANPCEKPIIPTSVIEPIDLLPVFRNGLSCQCCRYVCRAEEVMKRHQREMHGLRNGRGRRPARRWTSTWCQCFFVSAGQHYFAVARTNKNEPTIKAEVLRTQVMGQLEEKRQIIEQKKQVIMESDNPTEVSSWLERTQWLRHLQGQERAKMAETTQLPIVEEPMLQQVTDSLRRLIREAQQIVLQKKVSSFALHRINGFQAIIESEKPLNVKLDERTLEKYERVWKKLLCYVLRTAKETPLYQLTATQRMHMDEVTKAAERAVELAAKQSDKQASEQAIDEEVKQQAMELGDKCLRFCMALLDHRLDHDEYESAVISYLAAAGLQQGQGQDRDQYKFADALDYTPILSGLIKGAQMLVVQHCFWMEERKEVDSCRRLLDELHGRFMTVGTATPIDWALRLRLYGRAIRNKTTAEGKIDWVHDIVTYGEIELSMPIFRQLIHKLCEETRTLLFDELLFSKGREGELPAFNWAELRDNPAKDDPDWYFIHDARNRLTDGSKWLLNRVLSRNELTESFLHGQQRATWKMGRVNDYFDSVSLFLEKLLVLMHMTGGQPARARELLSLRYCNTLQGGYRNIFIENGLMTFVTLYHKGYSITGSEKIIHRYLPREVGELLLYYIWLVLPFRQQLRQLASGDEEIPSAFLWSADWRKWTSDRVKAVIKRESDRLIGVPLNISSYRHIAIAIAERYMKKAGFEPDDQDKDKNDEHDEAIDEQSGHNSATAGAIYARWIQEAPGHVQQKRQKYRQASREWHEILEFAMPLARCKRGPEGDGEDSGRIQRVRRWQRLQQNNMHKALQKLMGQETRFRGKQEQAIQAIMDNESPIIAVMRTGGGKSLLFMLPASVEDAGTTVVVTPLLALKEDMQRRCRKLGINCIEWKGGKKPSQDASVMLVTPESAISKEFLNYMRQLQGMDRLDRIVIDECHILLNTRLNFRKKLQKLQKLIQFSVQMVLLTATLPPSKESELVEMMSLKVPLMIRDSTSRPNVAYSVQVYPAGNRDPDGVVVELVQQRLEQYINGERIIVYGGSVEHCKDLAEKLRCQAYYAAAEEKSKVLQDWLNGRTQVVVATNALGLGIDMPNVRLVLHAEPPQDLLNYGQESGRAGRDGLRSEAIIMTRRLSTQRTFNSVDERLLHEYMASKGCRRQTLDRYLDGNFETVECAKEQETCDNCRLRWVFNNIAAEAEVTAAVAVENVSQADVAVDPDDEAKYEQEQANLRRQQQVYCQARMQRAEVLHGFEQKLKQLRDRCPHCYYYGLDDEHRFHECEAGQETYLAYKQVKTMIRYAKYAACWGCGCPQWICREFLPGGSKKCQYPDVVLAGATVALVDGETGGGNARIQEMAGRAFDTGVQAVEWFGEMTGMARKQASNAARVFWEVFSTAAVRQWPGVDDNHEG